MDDNFIDVCLEYVSICCNYVLCDSVSVSECVLKSIMYVCMYVIVILAKHFGQRNS